MHMANHQSQGTIWTVSVDSTSTFLVSGSADNQLRLWRVSTGECLKVWEFPTAIKRAAFSEDDSKILACTEARMGYSGRIAIMDVNYENDGKTQADEPALSIDCSRSKAAVAGWTALDKYIVSAHEDGSICQWDPKDGELVNRVANVHEATVMDMQMSQDRTYCLTASRDKTAKVGTHRWDDCSEFSRFSPQLIDCESLEVIKAYITATPLNSASLLPEKPYVLLGGGQDAMNVTTTGARQGQFEIRFWHRYVFLELPCTLKEPDYHSAQCLRRGAGSCKRRFRTL